MPEYRWEVSLDVVRANRERTGCDQEDVKRCCRMMTVIALSRNAVGVVMQSREAQDVAAVQAAMVKFVNGVVGLYEDPDEMHIDLLEFGKWCGFELRDEEVVH